MVHTMARYEMAYGRVRDTARRYYLAYGSNLNVPQMRMRCPWARVVGTAELQGWRLLFKGSRTGLLQERSHP